MTNESNANMEQARAIVAALGGTVTEEREGYAISAAVDGINLFLSWSTWKKAPKINVAVMAPKIPVYASAYDFSYTAPMPPSVEIGHGVNPNNSAKRLANGLLIEARTAYAKHAERLAELNETHNNHLAVVESLKKQYPNAEFRQTNPSDDSVYIYGIIPHAKIRVDDGRIYFEFRDVVSPERLAALAKALEV